MSFCHELDINSIRLDSNNINLFLDLVKYSIASMM